MSSYTSSTTSHNSSQCCGIQIDFYEHCGHTLTLTDHSPTCTHSSPSLAPPPPAFLRRRPGLPSSPRPKAYQPQLATNPEPNLNCHDLHRYIRFFPRSCTCTNNLDPELYPSTRPTRSDPQHKEIAKDVIFQRRMYWLHQHSLENTKARNVGARDAEDSLKRKREWEEVMRVPWAERTFVFDPSGKVGDFFSEVEVEGLEGREKTCAICRRGASEERSRRLPCGCVMCLECVVGWMKERKDCAVCGKVFKLINVGSLRGEETSDSLSWGDDEWDEFI